MLQFIDGLVGYTWICPDENKYLVFWDASVQHGRHYDHGNLDDQYDKISSFRRESEEALASENTLIESSNLWDLSYSRRQIEHNDREYRLVNFTWNVSQDLLILFERVEYEYVLCVLLSHFLSHVSRKPIFHSFEARHVISLTL